MHWWGQLLHIIYLINCSVVHTIVINLQINVADLGDSDLHSLEICHIYYVALVCVGVGVNVGVYVQSRTEFLHCT